MRKTAHWGDKFYEEAIVFKIVVKDVAVDSDAEWMDGYCYKASIG